MRGNADTDRLARDRNNQILHVIDNGVGMDDISRLFQLGNTSAPARPTSVSTCRPGLLKALLWLGHRCRCEPSDKGDAGFVDVTWNDLRKYQDLSQIQIPFDKMPLLISTGAPEYLTTTSARAPTSRSTCLLAAGARGVPQA